VRPCVDGDAEREDRDDAEHRGGVRPAERNPA